jgi:poly(3-hydroxyalkanoate) synthetase
MNSKHKTNELKRRPGAPPEAPRSTSTLEAFFDWPLEAATLVAQAYARLFEDLMSPKSGRRSASSGSSLPWTTPNVIALELPSMRLRDFSTGTVGSATLICAPYALHGATIADFAPDHSVVETPCHSGLSRVFVTDWRSATPETRYFTIDSYLADLNVAVDQLGPPVDLIGLCWLALVYAARFPKKVRRLGLVGAPIDTATAESQLSRFVAGVPFSMFDELVRLGEGIVDGERTLKAWGLSDDSNEAETVLQNPPNIDPVRRRELTDRFQQWYSETVNLPGIFYLQVVKWLFRENQIAEGRFIALGQRVDLMSMRAPIFLLAAGNDEIVPAGQLFATARLVGTPAERLVKMTEPCGHLSLFLGAVVLDEAWRNIARWLDRDLNKPQID